MSSSPMRYIGLAFSTFFFAKSLLMLKVLANFETLTAIYLLIYLHVYNIFLLVLIKN